MSLVDLLGIAFVIVAGSAAVAMVACAVLDADARYRCDSVTPPARSLNGGDGENR